jgi:hypothetical protein
MSTTPRRPATPAAVLSFCPLVVLSVLAFATVPASAAGLAAASAREIAGHLTSAMVTSADLGLQVRNMAGKKANADLQRGVAAVDSAVAAAQRLGNQSPDLEPGFGHVRTNMAQVIAEGKVSEGASALIDESVAELHALIVNAYLLAAVAELDDAAGALDKKNGTEVSFYLKNAAQDLQSANEMGGYHIENDIEDIQAALRDIDAKVSAKVAVPRDAIDMRVAELKSHMFQLGTE